MYNVFVVNSQIVQTLIINNEIKKYNILTLQCNYFYMRENNNNGETI